MTFSSLIKPAARGRAIPLGFRAVILVFKADWQINRRRLERQHKASGIGQFEFAAIAARHLARREQVLPFGCCAFRSQGKIKTAKITVCHHAPRVTASSKRTRTPVRIIPSTILARDRVAPPSVLATV